MIVFSVAAAAAVSAGQLQSYDCRALDSAFAERSFRVVADANLKPVFIEGDDITQTGRMNAVLEEGGGVGQLRFFNGDVEYLLTLRRVKKETEVISVSIEEENWPEFPYRFFRYSGICVRKSSSAPFEMPQRSDMDEASTLWFVRFIDSEKKRMSTSWSLQCKVLDEVMVSHDLTVRLELSDKRLDFDSTSPASGSVTGDDWLPFGGSALRGWFAQSLEDKRRFDHRRLLNLTTRLEAPSEDGRIALIVFMGQAPGGSISQASRGFISQGELIPRVLIERSGRNSKTLAAGMCNPIQMGQEFSRDFQ